MVSFAGPEEAVECSWGSLRSTKTPGGEGFVRVAERIKRGV